MTANTQTRRRRQLLEAAGRELLKDLERAGLTELLIETDDPDIDAIDERMVEARAENVAVLRRAIDRVIAEEDL